MKGQEPPVRGGWREFRPRQEELGEGEPFRSSAKAGPKVLRPDGARGAGGGAEPLDCLRRRRPCLSGVVGGRDVAG